MAGDGSWLLREEIYDISQQLQEKGYIAANDGNISTRYGKSYFMITPTGIRKSEIQPEELLIVDESGKVIDGPEGLVTTSEFLMHARIYQVRPDINAIVHAHPPYATAFAILNKAMDGDYLPEIIYFMDKIGYAPYGTPGIPDLADQVESVAKKHDAFLMANHGAVGIGADLKSAWWNLERTDHMAKIIVKAQVIGEPVELSKSQVKAIKDLK